MANRKPRAPKPRDPIAEFVLDATGTGRPPTMTEILTSGSPDEVREFLGGQGALMRAGAPLPSPVADWLGAALEAIGRGDDANRALRVEQTARGRLPMGVRERSEIEHQIADLVEQGVSRKDAAGIVERCLIAQRHNDAPDALRGKTEDDHEMASERLRKRLNRRSQGTK